MGRNFDGIDIFFIVTIAIYLLVLTAFIVVFCLELKKDKNDVEDKTLKNEEANNDNLLEITENKNKTTKDKTKEKEIVKNESKTNKKKTVKTKSKSSKANNKKTNKNSKNKKSNNKPKQNSKTKQKKKKTK